MTIYFIYLSLIRPDKNLIEILFLERALAKRAAKVATTFAATPVIIKSLHKYSALPLLYTVHHYLEVMWYITQNVLHVDSAQLTTVLS